MRMKKTTRKQLRTIRRRRLALALVGAMAMPLLPAMAQSLPSGYTVVNGDPTIASAGNQMTVTQTTKGAIIDWGSFNIGAGYGVTFDQQFGTSSVTLNRVIGFGYSGSPSQINGTLTSNGWLTPNCTSAAAPFHTFCVVTALPGSYMRWVSWKRKPQFSSARLSSARCFSEAPPSSTAIRRWSPRWAELSRQ